jgi:hypothetical protein
MTVTRQYSIRLVLAAPVLALGVLTAGAAYAAPAGGPPGGGDDTPIPGAPANPGGGAAPAIGEMQDGSGIFGNIAPELLAGLPGPVCFKSANQPGQATTDWDGEVHAMLGPNCQTVVGVNTGTNHTSIQIDPATGIPQNQALDAARQATTAFDNTLHDNPGNFSTATNAALSKLKTALAAPGGGLLPSLNRPTLPNATAPSLPSNLPSISTPSVNHHHWVRYLWWLIPLALLLLAAGLLSRLLRRDRTTTTFVEPKRTTAYTAPTTRPAATTMTAPVAKAPPVRHDAVPTERIVTGPPVVHTDDTRLSTDDIVHVNPPVVDETTMVERTDQQQWYRAGDSRVSSFSDEDCDYFETHPGDTPQSR